MACFELSLKSEALGGQTSISVILPIFEAVSYTHLTLPTNSRV